jgi:hypothetical protein
MGTLDDYPLQFEQVKEDPRRIRRLSRMDRFSNGLKRLTLRLSIKRYMKLNRGKQNHETRPNGDTNAVVRQKDTSHNKDAPASRRWRRRRIGLGWHRWRDLAGHIAAGKRRTAKRHVVDDQLDI